MFTIGGSHSAPWYLPKRNEKDLYADVPPLYIISRTVSNPVVQQRWLSKPIVIQQYNEIQRN